MDGASPTAQLPSAQFPAPLSLPGQIPAPPGMMPQQQRPNGPVPVGRPSSDPDKQEERSERVAQKRRLEAILPKEMTDGKVSVFRLKGRTGRVKTDPRPVLTALFKELETAGETGVEASVYIRQKLEEKYGERGRFLCSPQDRRGTTISEFGEFEIDLGSDGIGSERDEMEDHDDDENDQMPDFRAQRESRPYNYPPPPPGPAPALDPVNFAKEIRDLTNDEKSAGQSNMALMMTMMNQNSQAQANFMAQQNAAAEQRRREDEARADREEERENRRMEEQRRRDEDRKEREEKREEERRVREEQRERDRMEKERDERKGRRDMLTTLIPLLLPMIAKMFEGKTDTMTPMLMKMLDGKNDRDGSKELFSMFQEASKQAMLTQGEATRGLLGAQSEAAKTMINNVMSLAQTMVESQLEAQNAPETDDPMEKIARAFKMFQPAIAAMSQNSNVAGNAAANIAQRGASAPNMGVPPQQQPPAQPSRANMPNTPDAEWIKGALQTVMKLEMGTLAVEQRPAALVWCAKNLPEPMLAAIRANDEDKVMEVAAQGIDQEIMAWLMEDEHQVFLRTAIADIRLVILGAFDQAAAIASVKAHRQYQATKGQAPAAPVLAEAVPEKKPAAKRSAPMPAPAAAAPVAPAAEKVEEKPAEPEEKSE